MGAVIATSRFKRNSFENVSKNALAKDNVLIILQMLWSGDLCLPQMSNTEKSKSCDNHKRLKGHNFLRTDMPVRRWCWGQQQTGHRVGVFVFCGDMDPHSRGSNWFRWPRFPPTKISTFHFWLSSGSQVLSGRLATSLYLLAMLTCVYSLGMQASQRHSRTSHVYWAPHVLATHSAKNGRASVTAHVEQAIECCVMHRTMKDENCSFKWHGAEDARCHITKSDCR